MKKRILSLLLVATMLLSLLPMMVFATGTTYAITNGSPEGDKETNHGYITVKTSAAEGETITITVKPNEGYQLKSLTVTPVAPAEYTVTFDLNGITGTAPTSQTIKDGEKVTKPTDPTDTIHTFAGWYKTKDATTGSLSDPWDFDNGTVTANMTLYAQWERTMESILSTNPVVPKVTDLTPPSNAWANSTSPDCKAFVGIDAEGDTLFVVKKEGQGVQPLGLLMDDTFVRINENTYKYNDDYVTVIANMTDGKFTSCEWKFILSNYQFLDGTYTAPAAPTEYNVTFDLNGITGTAPTAQKIKDGDKVTKPTDPTDTIHTFAGWYKTKDATTGSLSDPWDFDNGTVTANMTLYAQWTRTLGSIYGTNENVPKADNNTAPDNAWVNDDGGKAFIAYSGKTSEVLYFYKKLEPSGAKQLSCRKTENFTKIGDDYVLFYELGGKQYGVFTLHMTDSKFTSVTYDGTGTDYEILSGTYSPVSQCIAAGTMISMPEGNQKAVEELEIGDVINTFDHETGEVSSAPVAFIWESKNAGNAFTLTFEDDVEVTVIEEHGFYDQEEQKYVFINLQNAEEYIGDHFYNADTNSWLALKNCEALNESIDAYAIITSGDLNHMSNGMLSMCDGTVKVLANIFEYDNQMKFDADKKKADIEAYGLTPKEKILELEGFIESDYDDYNLQYLNVAIGKGLTTWEWIEAFSDYCVENGLVDIYSGSETAEKNEAPKMLLMSATAPKTLLGSTPEPTPQDGIEIKANENGTYTFIMPGYPVTVTAEFEEVPAHTHNLVKVNGQAATETAAGFKDYYECKDSTDACHKYFEDATAKVEITDLAKWKAQGGNGYIAKLEKEPTSPQTGDNSNMTLWLIMMALSSMGLCLVLGKKSVKF